MVHHKQRRPNPGALPQTAARPGTTGGRFQAALWQGIATGSTAAAMPAFFPLAAYAQVKAIANPGADYRDRLVHDFRLDIGAAHALVVGGAVLVGVSVPSGLEHWVPSGTCFNRVGYWEVPNARVVYRQGGATRSLGIASMISWRGVWYVIHFGAVLRSADQGVVDDPAIGPGASSASSTC